MLVKDKEVIGMSTSISTIAKSAAWVQSIELLDGYLCMTILRKFFCTTVQLV